MLDSGIGVVGVLVCVVNVTPRADRGEHLSRGDEVIVCARRDGEDGVAQPGGISAAAEDVLLTHAGCVHDVKREQHASLLLVLMLLLLMMLPRRRRARERDVRQPAQHGGDALRLSDVRGQVIGRDARERQRGQRKVQQRGVRGLCVGLHRGEVFEGRVRGVRLARGYYAQRPCARQA